MDFTGRDWVRLCLGREHLDQQSFARNKAMARPIGLELDTELWHPLSSCRGWPQFADADADVFLRHRVGAGVLDGNP